MQNTPDPATPQPSPPKPLGKGEVPTPAEGLDLLTGKKGLTEARKGLRLVKLSKEQEEVELRRWRPKKREEYIQPWIQEESWRRKTRGPKIPVEGPIHHKMDCPAK